MPELAPVIKITLSCSDDAFLSCADGRGGGGGGGPLISICRVCIINLMDNIAIITIMAAIGVEIIIAALS